MFTEADHAKAVELYDKYAGEEWFPDVTWHPDGGWCMHHFEFGWIEMGRSHALSAIAWAMEDALGSRGDFSVGNTESGEWVVTLQTNYGRPPMETRNASRFLALAAAIEDQK